MRAQGILKLASVGAVTLNGQQEPFVLKLVAHDHLRPWPSTWHIRWPGRKAETFWRRHGLQLQPGRSVHVELEDVHGLPGPDRREAALSGLASDVVLLPQWDGLPACT